VQARVAATVAAMAKPTQPVVAAPTSAPAAAPAHQSPTQAPITLEGHGQTQTEPINLSGDYSLAWSVRSSDERACIITGMLKSADKQWAGEFLMTMQSVPPGETKTGETHTYRREPGRYYMEMSTTTCDWSVTITPQ